MSFSRGMFFANYIVTMLAPTPGLTLIGFVNLVIWGAVSVMEWRDQRCHC